MSAIFAGLFFGCYRNSGNSWYLYLIPVVLGGFALCGLGVYLALSVDAKGAEQWLGKIDRISGRDFAYLLVILALINRLGYFRVGRRLRHLRVRIHSDVGYLPAMGPGRRFER